jgi:hypothetical protein
VLFTTWYTEQIFRVRVIFSSPRFLHFAIVGSCSSSWTQTAPAHHKSAAVTRFIWCILSGQHQRVGMAILPAGVDIRRISDPTGAGVGAIFHPRVRPAPAPRIGWCGRGFYFSPVSDPRISEISNFDGFDLVSPPKYPSISKFWPSPIISPT